MYNTIGQARLKRFEYGAFDCVGFAADIVQAMTDFDPMSAYRARYHNQAEAAALLASEFNNDLEYAVAIVAKRCGFEEIRPKSARRGDLALIDIHDGAALGIVTGLLLAFPGERGPVFVSRGRARRAWAVG